MDDFSTPDQPNVYGLAPGRANFIRPGKKPYSSMSPMLVEQDGALRMAIGASGGPRIISAVVQGLLRWVSWGTQGTPGASGGLVDTLARAAGCGDSGMTPQEGRARAPGLAACRSARYRAAVCAVVLGAEPRMHVTRHACRRATRPSPLWAQSAGVWRGRVFGGRQSAPASPAHPKHAVRGAVDGRATRIRVQRTHDRGEGRGAPIRGAEWRGRMPIASVPRNARGKTPRALCLSTASGSRRMWQPCAGVQCDMA